MSSIRQFKEEPSDATTLVGVLTIGGLIIGMMISAVVIEFNPMVALIIMGATLVWVIGGGFTYFMLASEPVHE